MAEKKEEAQKTRLLGPDVAPGPTEESLFYVDDKPVSEEAYYAAAEKVGWIPVIMREQNFRQPISTKKHGE